MDDIGKPSVADLGEPTIEGPTANEIARAFGIPWPLAKASRDPFQYAVGLRTGEVLEFESCEFDEDHVWVTLNGVCFHTIDFRGSADSRMTFERGFVVRIVDIMWATDAPWGS